MIYPNVNLSPVGIKKDLAITAVQSPSVWNILSFVHRKHWTTVKDCSFVPDWGHSIRRSDFLTLPVRYDTLYLFNACNGSEAMIECKDPNIFVSSAILLTG